MGLEVGAGISCSVTQRLRTYLKACAVLLEWTSAKVVKGTSSNWIALPSPAGPRRANSAAEPSPGHPARVAPSSAAIHAVPRRIRSLERRLVGERYFLMLWRFWTHFHGAFMSQVLGAVQDAKNPHACCNGRCFPRDFSSTVTTSTAVGLLEDSRTLAWCVYLWKEEKRGPECCPSSRVQMPLGTEATSKLNQTCSTDREQATSSSRTIRLAPNFSMAAESQRSWTTKQGGHVSTGSQFTLTMPTRAPCSSGPGRRFEALSEDLDLANPEERPRSLQQVLKAAALSSFFCLGGHFGLHKRQGSRSCRQSA